MLFIFALACSKVHTMGRRCTSTKRRSEGATLWLTGPDVALKPFGAFVHIDWLEMKNGSKAHEIAARALLITDQETEFLGVLAHFVTVPYRHASKAERTNRTAVGSTRASLLQAGFPDTWWAVCMIYFVAMWNGHMRGRDGFTPYQHPWGSLVFAHLHKPVAEDEEESDRWRSKLTLCTLVEVTTGPGRNLGALLRRCASLQVHWLESAVGCARETQHRH